MSEISLTEKLTMKKVNIYEEANKEKLDKIFDFSKGYMDYLDNGKTEREATDEGMKLAIANGFTEYKLGAKVKPGDKLYYNNRGKSLYVMKIGTKDINEDGIKILAAHIDSPRLDLKQIPLYEDSGMAFLKTHYYGGIKKYQWTAMPLALHGVIIKNDGEKITVKIGEDPSDPVFYINDLLPHLAHDQASRPLGSAIPGEALNILVGGLPLKDGDKSSIKLGVLNILNEKYGIKEDDFLSAELTAVPAFNARDIGFDRAFIGAYGHDDRVCGYPLLKSIFDTDTESTVLGILADKEEIGSVGNTGMQSMLLLDIINCICDSFGASSVAVRSNSKCLSADVNAAFDPNFAEVYEKRNTCLVSCGTTMSKYVGAGGKSGTSDASAEFVGYIRKIFTEEGVEWQTSELGKIDVGGGGTIAYLAAKYGMNVLDAGVSVLSMHAPWEITSAYDIDTAYRAYIEFLKIQ